MCNSDKLSLFIFLLLDTLPLEYTATPTRTRPPSYTDQHPPEYSNEPPPEYSDIHLYPSSHDFSRVSCEQARGQSRNTAISIISHPKENSVITSSNVAYTGSFPIGHEHIGISRVYTEALVGPRSTDTSSLAGSGQNSTSIRHGVNTVPHTAHRAYPEQRRSQLKNTAVRLTAPESHGGNELLRGNALICMAVCAILWCPFTGIFAVYHVYRKHKFLAREERNKARQSAHNAIVAILWSFALFLMWFMPLFYAIILAKYAPDVNVDDLY